MSESGSQVIGFKGSIRLHNMVVYIQLLILKEYIRNGVIDYVFKTIEYTDSFKVI